MLNARFGPCADRRADAPFGGHERDDRRALSNSFGRAYSPVPASNRTSEHRTPSFRPNALPGGTLEKKSLDLFSDADNTYVQDVEGFENEEAAEPIDPVSFWTEKQRDLVTSVVDYNLSTLAELIRDKQIDLSPAYQRRFRWDAKRQSLLIESFLMNVPVPPVFLNEDELGKYSVIDGKQRLNAISSMLGGKLTLVGLKVFSDLNGLAFDQLPNELQTVLRVRPTIRAVVILRQSDADIKFEVFKRLNTGGVRLNAQEIRNSTYPGPLNNLILRLSEDTAFHRLLRIKNKQRSAIFQEMRDAEFVLRFFTFRNSWDKFQGGMMRAMDRFMADHKNASAKEVSIMETAFRRALRAVEAAFGDNAFQRWQPEKKSWRKPVLASLFDAQMFAVQDMDPAQLTPKRARIVAALKARFSDEEFRKTVDAATNTPASFRDRIRAVRDLVQRC